MKILKKFITSMLCSAMVLCMGFSAIAAENTEKTVGQLVGGDLTKKVAVSTKNMNKGLPSTSIPTLENKIQSKMLWEFGIRGIMLFPLGEKDGQVYRFADYYFNFGGTVANPTNEWIGVVPTATMQKIVSDFSKEGYTHVGWEQKTLYQIRSGYIPRQIKYYINSYGTGPVGGSIPLNSSHSRYDGSFSVQYGVGYIPTNPYAGWVYGEYASMILDNVSIIEFLASVEFNG